MIDDLDLTQKMHENALKAAEILGQYLDGKKQGGEMVRQASLTITQYFKHRATKGVEASVTLAVIKMVAKDKADLRVLIHNALPEYIVDQKAIGPKPEKGARVP